MSASPGSSSISKSDTSIASIAILAAETGEDDFVEVGESQPIVRA